MDTFYDVIFCILDLFVAGFILKWILKSRTIKVEAKAGSKMVLCCLFFFAAALSFINEDGWLRYYQTIALSIIGIMYYFVKSGVSDEGIVTSGILTPWIKVKKVTLNHTENSISYEYNNKPYRLYFEKYKMNDVRNILQKNGKKKEEGKK